MQLTLSKRWILISIILFISKGYSQNPTADISIENPQTNGSQFSFEVHITQTNDWKPFFGGLFSSLGDCSWFFDFNNTALNNPVLTHIGSIVASGSGYNNTVGIIGGKIGITTDLQTGFGVNLNQGEDYHVYTVTMNILDPLQLSQVSWNEGNTAIFGVLDNTEVIETLSGNGDITLPVELNSFSATTGDNKVILTWTTQSEVNNLGFEVYRSAEENGEYAMIASYENNESLQGAGNSNAAREYTYEDRMLFNGETYWYQIADVDYQGVRTFHGPVSVESPDLIPEEYALHPNFPNPFNPETSIRFEIPANPASSKVKLVIYNNLGMEVRTLVNGTVEPGVHTVKWDGRNNRGEQMTSGVYFLHIQAGTFNHTQKMLLVR